MIHRNGILCKIKLLKCKEEQRIIHSDKKIRKSLMLKLGSFWCKKIRYLIISDDSYTWMPCGFQCCDLSLQCAKSQLVWFEILPQYGKFEYLPGLEKAQFQGNPVKWFVIMNTSEIILASFRVQKSEMKVNTRY